MVYLYSYTFKTKLIIIIIVKLNITNTVVRITTLLNTCIYMNLKYKYQISITYIDPVICKLQKLLKSSVPLHLRTVGYLEHNYKLKLKHLIKQKKH